MPLNNFDGIAHDNNNVDAPTISSISSDTPPGPKETVAPFAPPQQQNHHHEHEGKPRPFLNSAPLYWSAIHHKDLHSQDAPNKDSLLNQSGHKKTVARGENHTKPSNVTKTNTRGIVGSQDHFDIPDEINSKPSGHLETIPSHRELIPEEQHRLTELSSGTTETNISCLQEENNDNIPRIIQEKERLLEKKNSSRSVLSGYGSTNCSNAIPISSPAPLTSLYLGEKDLEQGGDPQQKQSAYPAQPDQHNAPKRQDGWNKVREMVHTDELFIHTIPDMKDEENANEDGAMVSSSRRRSSLFQSLRGGKQNNTNAKSKIQKSSSRGWNIMSTSKQPSTTNDNKKWSDLDDVTYEFTLRECLFLTVFLLTIGVTAYSFLFEQWSIIDSLYFTTVCLTTVGYGDYSPSTPSGKLFASVFALGGVVVLGLALGIFGSQLVEAEIKYTDKMKERTAKALESAFTATIRRRKRHHEKKKEKEGERWRLSNRNTDPSTRSLLRSSSNGSTNSLSSLESTDSAGSLESGMMSIRSIRPKDDNLKAVLIEKQNDNMIQRVRNCVVEWYFAIRLHSPGFIPMVVGAMIMAWLEQWAWYDGIYYCVVTATTIGFGDLSPTQPHTKLFAIVFVPVCVAAMGYILGNFASFMVEQRREGYDKKLWSCDLKIEDIEALDTDHDGAVSELEYIRFMLIAMKKVDAQLLDDLHAQFCHLDTTGDGKITKRDLQVMAARKLRKVSHKLELSEYKHKLKQIKGNKRSFLLNAISRRKSFQPQS